MKRRYLVLLLSCIVNSSFAANVYCPQGFDAVCTGGPVPKCTFYNYTSNLPQIPNLKINGSEDGTFTNLVFDSVQWSGTNPIFHNSVVCSYKNEKNQHLSILSYDRPKTFKPDVSLPNHWKSFISDGQTIYQCQKVDTALCPFQA